MKLAIHQFRGGHCQTLLIAFLSILIISCNNLEQGADAFFIIPQAKYATVSGSISLPGGAMPSSRSAIPAIPASAIYHVQATGTDINGNPKTVSSPNAAVNTTTMTYTVSGLDVNADGIDWTVKVWVEDSSNNEIMSASKTLRITDVNPVYTHDFLLQTNNSGGNGKIGLTMSVPDSVLRVTATCSSPGWTSASPSVVLSGTTVTISSNSIATGYYTVQFDFWDSATGGLLLYSDTQTINVFKYMETGTWVYTGGAGPIKSNGTYEVTAALIEDFARTSFYVGTSVYGTAAADNPGTVFAPVQTIDQALTLIKALNKGTKDYTIFITGTQTGLQAIDDTFTSSHAHSLTLSGSRGLDDSGVPQDVLDGNHLGTTLKISTLVPVTIKNLKITGGLLNQTTTSVSIKRGAGIQIWGVSDTDKAKLTLGSGTLITGNTVQGAIVSYNQARGGGLYLAYANVTMLDGAKISGNNALNEPGGSATYYGSGGGVYIYTGGSFIMKGGEISGNHSDSSVGGIYGDTGTEVKIEGGKITGNDAVKNAGGILGGTVTITGGEISGNTTGSGFTGGAVDCTTLIIGNTAYIPQGASGTNDVACRIGTGKIQITSNLSKHSASDKIKVSPVADYKLGKTLLEGNGVELSTQIGKFEVSCPGYTIDTTTGKMKFKNIITTLYVGGTGAADPTGNWNKDSTWNSSFTSSLNETTSYMASHHFATLSAALQFLTYQESASDYTIYISGELSGAQSVASNLDNANKITLQGPNTENLAVTATSIKLSGSTGSGTDKLNGGFSSSGSKGKTLNISTSNVPVTITKLGITGGYNTTEGKGGGIYIGTGTTVILDSDTKIYGNTATNGGGIYNQGTLIMKSSSIVGDLTSRTSPAVSTGGSNIATSNGGGIYTVGTVWIGYKSAAANDPDSSFSGGVGYNRADASGGGIFIDYTDTVNGSVYISKGQISYNSSNGNGASYGGGGVFVNSGSNYSKRGWFYMNGGSMLYNWHRGSNGSGGGVYLKGYSGMNMSGDAKITYEAIKKSDVYGESSITVAGNLTCSGTAATFTPSSYSIGKYVFGAAPAYYSSASSKIALAQTGDNSSGRFKIEQIGNVGVITLDLSKVTSRTWITNYMVDKTFSSESDMGYTFEYEDVKTFILQDTNEGALAVVTVKCTYYNDDEDEGFQEADFTIDFKYCTDTLTTMSSNTVNHEFDLSTGLNDGYYCSYGGPAPSGSGSFYLWKENPYGDFSLNVQSGCSWYMLP